MLNGVTVSFSQLCCMIQQASRPVEEDNRSLAERTMHRESQLPKRFIVTDIVPSALPLLPPASLASSSQASSDQSLVSCVLRTFIIPARSFQVTCVMGLESYKSYHASRSQSFDSIFRTLRPSLQSSSRRTSDPPNFLVRPFVSTSSSSKRAHQDPRHKIKRVLTFDLLWYRAPSLQTPTIRPARPTHTRATTYFLRFSWCQQVKRNMKMSSPTSDRLPHDVHLNSLRVYAVL